MVATIELKRHLTFADVLGVVVGEFCHQYKPCPVILLPIHKSRKVYFHCAVLLFRLLVCLRVKRGKEASLDVEEVTERRPKLGCKNRFLVTYDEVQEAVILYHHVFDYFC